MKITWRMMFTQFRADYPELFKRGISYQPDGIGKILISIPTIGRLTYYYDTHEIAWIERWNDDRLIRRIEQEQRPDMYERFRESVIWYIRDRQMTQQQFADMTGISRQSLSKYLNGDAIPKVSTMRHICEMVNIDI